jgi:hypothetical protein
VESDASAPPEPRRTVQIACDESGFVGGSLFGGTRVFAHASLHLDPDSASELAEEVRGRLEAGSPELKASRLNRPWARPVAAWLCAPDGPLQGRAVVHVTDTRLFGLARLAQVLMTDESPEGWWSPREEPASWGQALRLDAVLEGMSPTLERQLLLAGRDLLWLRRSRRHAAPVEAWIDAVRAAEDRLPDAVERRFLAGWASADAVRRARDYVAMPPASPLVEPLLPALRWTVRHWSSLGDVDVVHDEQSVLTPARVAAIADELTTSYPGRRMTGFTRVDSRDDVRVQLADLVAGVVRRVLEGQFAGDGDPSVVPVAHLVAEDSLVLPPLSGARRTMPESTGSSRSSVGTTRRPTGPGN